MLEKKEAVRKKQDMEEQKNWKMILKKQELDA